MTETPTVILVHGAFADASGYAGVIRRLQAMGLARIIPTLSQSERACTVTTNSWKLIRSCFGRSSHSC